MKTNIKSAGAKKGKKASKLPNEMHELLTRLLELEEQNKSLNQARAESDAAYRRYTDLYDFAPVGYFTLTRDGVILQVNLAGANLLGVDHDQLPLCELDTFISSESSAVFNTFWNQLLTGEGKETCELALKKTGRESAGHASKPLVLREAMSAAPC